MWGERADFTATAGLLTTVATACWEFRPVLGEVWRANCYAPLDTGLFDAPSRARGDAARFDEDLEELFDKGLGDFAALFG